MSEASNRQRPSIKARRTRNEYRMTGLEDRKRRTMAIPVPIASHSMPMIAYGHGLWTAMPNKKAARSQPESFQKGTWLGSDSEIANIAILHDVIFALDSRLPLFTASRFSATFYVVLIWGDFCPDEVLFKIGVDDAGGGGGS